MKPSLLVAVLLLAVPAFAFAATTSVPPGANAPAALVGTWQTTLTAADVRRTVAPDASRTWQLVIVNGRYLAYPRALGFRPRGSGGDTVPFGVKGHRLYLSCLNGDAVPSKGFATYGWTISGKTMHLKLIAEPCRDPILRDRIIILTSAVWKKVGR
jgi:hypothetical protein